MEKLLPDIEEFCTFHGLSEWQFGELALRDRKFLGQLREGRDIRMSTVDRLRAFMTTYAAKAA